MFKKAEGVSMLANLRKNLAARKNGSDAPGKSAEDSSRKSPGSFLSRTGSFLSRKSKLAPGEKEEKKPNSLLEVVEEEEEVSQTKASTPGPVAESAAGDTGPQEEVSQNKDSSPGQVAESADGAAGETGPDGQIHEHIQHSNEALFFNLNVEAKDPKLEQALIVPDPCYPFSEKRLQEVDWQNLDIVPQKYRVLATITLRARPKQIENSATDEAANEDVVEETIVPQFNDEGQEIDPEVLREEATQALQKAMAEAKEAPDLEEAIKVAEAAKVGKIELRDAKKRARVLYERQRVRLELLEAVKGLDVHILRRAIENAKHDKVDEKDIAMAEDVLRVEQPKQDARDELKAALDRGQRALEGQQQAPASDLEPAIAALKKGISFGVKVKLLKKEVDPAKEMLQKLEDKLAAERALKEAVKTRHVEKLRAGIKQAKLTGVGAAFIAEAEEVFRIEEPKQIARDMIKEAIATLHIDNLKKGIEAGKKAGITQEEINKAQDIVVKEEKKFMARQRLQKMLEDTESLPDDVDTLAEIKKKIEEEIKRSTADGLTDEEVKNLEVRRKRVHNAVEDIKGSIRVFCRIRPLSKKEVNQGDYSITEVPDSFTINLKQGGKFTFDAVFTPGTQEEVFEDCRDLVQSAIDGYNVTLFAYGQTGAGKTFTMYGVPGMEGTCPRAIKELFRLKDELSARFEFKVSSSFIELYRNALVDLSNKAALMGKAGDVLNVRQDNSGEVQIENMREKECATKEELEQFLEDCMKQRTVAATAMNSESSRSHLIMMVKIQTRNLSTGEQAKGKILLCDLAGSERLKKSEVTGDMQKEAIEINKSLTALGDVIEALTKKQKQVPYRNHKLTQVMQDSLGGSAKTLMFLNCSPAASNFDETLNALKYAARAKKITNTAVKKT